MQGAGGTSPPPGGALFVRLVEDGLAGAGGEPVRPEQALLAVPASVAADGQAFLRQRRPKTASTSTARMACPGARPRGRAVGGQFLAAVAGPGPRRRRRLPQGPRHRAGLTLASTWAFTAAVSSGDSTAASASTSTAPGATAPGATAPWQPATAMHSQTAPATHAATSTTISTHTAALTTAAARSGTRPSVCSGRLPISNAPA